MSSRKPPVPAYSFENLTPDTIRLETQAIIRETVALHDELAARLTPTTATFANLIQPIVDRTNRTEGRLHILGHLMATLSPDSSVQQAARQAEDYIAAAVTRLLMRRDIATLVAAVYAAEAEFFQSWTNLLEPEDRHLLRRVYENYKSMGAFLQTDEERESLHVMQEEIMSICSAAENALTEPEQGVWFERDELSGVPKSALNTMTQSADESKLQVMFNHPHCEAVMRHCIRSDIRERLARADWHRFPENVDRMGRILVLRDRIARLLGYKNHFESLLVNNMAPDNLFVRKQLQELHAELHPIGLRDVAGLLEIKRKDHTADPKTLDKIYAWDVAFYSRKRDQATSIAVDQIELAGYFSLRHTFDRMLQLYTQLFGLEFIYASDLAVWHTDVLAYEVWDTLDDGGAFVGYFYADLVTREGKHHRSAGCIDLGLHFIDIRGTKHYPSVALVRCYPHPTQTRPVLLQHSEVVILFHELGHAIHKLAARTKYAIRHSRDFDDLPGKMAENWMWTPEILVPLGRHHSTKQPMPRQLAEAVARTRTVGSARAMLGQLHPAFFDMIVHTQVTPPEAYRMDTTKCWNDLKRQVYAVDIGPDDQQLLGATHAQCMHLFDCGNSLGYFTYPITVAYATDIYQSMFAERPLNADAGRRWRYQVLERGGSANAMDHLKKCLGREPNLGAFCKIAAMDPNLPDEKPVVKPAFQQVAPVTYSVPEGSKRSVPPAQK